MIFPSLAHIHFIQMNTFVTQCPCCNDRILAIHGDRIRSSSVPSDMIPVADLTLCDLRILMQQISEHLKEGVSDL